MKINLKNKKTIIISALAIATVLVATASTITLPQKISKLLGKKTEALLAQDYLEVNRNDSPKFSVSYNSEKTEATITIDYISDATEKQYSIDGGRVWKNYEGEFTLNQNVTIYARYKTATSNDYIIGSTKVIIDLKYNLELQDPIVNMNTKNESNEEIEYLGDKVTKKDVSLNLSHPQEDDATIVYEAKISTYYIGTEDLVDSQGNIDEEAVLAQADNEGVSFKKIGDYIEETGYSVSEDNKQLTLKQTGIYKITIRATTNGGFVKSEEVSFIVAIDKINRTDLIVLKTADGENYTSGTWTNQNVTAYINEDATEAYATFNEAKQNGVASVIYKDKDGVESEIDLENFIANGKEFTEEGQIEISFKTQIGAIVLTMQQFEICIDKTAPGAPQVEIVGGTPIIVTKEDETEEIYYPGIEGLQTYRKANGTTYPTEGYYQLSYSAVRVLVNRGTDLSGVELMEFKNSDGTAREMFTDHYENITNEEYTGTKYEYSFTTGAQQSFAREYEIYSYDKAGNMSTHIVPVRVDKTAPTVEIKVNGGSQINGYYQGVTGITQIVNGVPRDNSAIKKVQAYLTWSDGESGIDNSRTELWVDGQKRDNVSYDRGDSNPPAITFDSSGTKTIKFVVYDKVGRSTQKEKEIKICLEHSGGTATCSTRAKCERCNAEYGDLGEHSFTSQQIANTYINTKATCLSPATYYYACSRCGASSKGLTNTTYEYGTKTNCSYAFVNLRTNAISTSHPTSGGDTYYYKCVKGCNTINSTHSMSVLTTTGGVTYKCSCGNTYQ